MAADAPRRFAPGGFRGVSQPPNPDDWSRLSDEAKDTKRGEEWMKRAYGWDVNADDSRPPYFRWVGEKILGKGVAVFKNGGVRSHGIGNYQRVVVKQVIGPEAKRSLKRESSILEGIFNDNEERILHLVSLIRAYHEDAGTGTDETFDPAYVHEFAPETVARSYTEYCEEGNFDDWLAQCYG